MTTCYEIRHPNYAIKQTNKNKKTRLTSSNMSQIFATQLPNASGEPASVTERSDDPGNVSDGICQKTKQSNNHNQMNK